MEEVLFAITESHLDTGLRGYPCGHCVTSHVDPKRGLLYAGREVHSLAYDRPEDVIHLLFFGEGDHEGKTWETTLRSQASISAKTVQAIESLPRDGHPMKLFSAALLLLGMIEGVGDYRQDCLQVIAKIPHLVATVINFHAGWGKTPSLVSGGGYMSNFMELLQLPHGKSASLKKVLEIFNILHYDHGGGNLSAFVGKAVASGLEDMYGSLSAAMCALAGPRHGKANQDSLEMLQQFVSQMGSCPSEKTLEDVVRKRLQEGKLIFGFGHAVLRVEDPRASLLYEYAEEHYPKHPLVQMALLLRKVVPKILQENPKVSCPYPNVDAISGAVLIAAGFDYPLYLPLLFGMARCVGISIQIVYERMEARDGKGTPIVRPKYLYRRRG